VRKISYMAVPLILGLILGFVISEKKNEVKNNSIFESYSVESAKLTAIRFSSIAGLTKLALDNEMDEFFDSSCFVLKGELKIATNTEHPDKHNWTMLTKALNENHQVVDRLESLGKCKTEI